MTNETENLSHYVGDIKRFIKNNKDNPSSFDEFLCFLKTKSKEEQCRAFMQSTDYTFSHWRDLYVGSACHKKRVMETIRCTLLNLIIGKSGHLALDFEDGLIPGIQVISVIEMLRYIKSSFSREEQLTIWKQKQNQKSLSALAVRTQEMPKDTFRQLFDLVDVEIHSALFIHCRFLMKAAQDTSLVNRYMETLSVLCKKQIISTDNYYRCVQEFFLYLCINKHCSLAHLTDCFKALKPSDGRMNDILNNPEQFYLSVIKNITQYHPEKSGGMMLLLLEECQDLSFDLDRTYLTNLKYIVRYAQRLPDAEKKMIIAQALDSKTALGSLFARDDNLLNELQKPYSPPRNHRDKSYVKEKEKEKEKEKHHGFFSLHLPPSPKKLISNVIGVLSKL